MFWFCPLVPPSAVIHTVHFQKKNTFCFKLILELTNLDRKIIILHIVVFLLFHICYQLLLKFSSLQSTLHNLLHKNTRQHPINLVWSKKHKALPRYTLGCKTRVIRFIGNLKSITLTMFCIFLQMQKINAIF